MYVCVCLQRRPWAPAAQLLVITQLLLSPGLALPGWALTSQVWCRWACDDGFEDKGRGCVTSWCLALPCPYVNEPLVRTSCRRGGQGSREMAEA